MKKVLLPLLLAAMMLIMSVTASAVNASAESKVISKGNAAATVSTATYSGKKKSASIKVKYKASGAVIDKAYYTVTYTQNGKKVDPKAAGKYNVTIKFKAPYSGTLTGQYTVNKAKQSAKVKVTKKNKSVKSKAQTYTASIAEKAEVASKRTKGSKKITCKGAKITVKKGTKNVKATIKLTTKATKNYKATTRTITVKVNSKGEVSFTVK